MAPPLIPGALLPQAGARLLCFAAIGLLAALLMGGATLADPGSPGRADDQLSVVVEGEFVSVEAREVPVVEVLRALGEQAGVAVVVRGEAEPVVSLSLAGVPLAEALRRLLRDTASAVVYERAAGRLVAVRVRLLGDAAVALPATLVDGPQPEAPRPDPAITPQDWRDDRLAFVRQAVRAPREGALDELAVLMLEDDDPGIRSSAAAALGRLRSQEAREVLSEALDDPDPGVRRAAARALGESGSEQAIEALGRVLAHERSPAVRQMAAWALSRMNTEAAVDALSAARRDRDRTVRNLARSAITRAGD